MSPDHTSGAARRAAAGLGLGAAALALASLAAPLPVLLLGGAAACLTGWALFGTDRPALVRFAVVSGVAVLLLAWSATEHSELVVDVTDDQIDASLNGVRLSASLAGVGGPVERVSVELGAVDERPVAAPWIFENLPWLRGVGEWLAGGLRGGVERLTISDTSGNELTAPVVGLWQPDHTASPPRLSGSLGAWEPVETADRTVALMSPALSAEQFRASAVLVRPSGQVRLTLGDAKSGDRVDVVAAPDRRLFEIVARPADGPASTLVGGAYVFRRSAIGWTQALLRELGRVWLVALALVAAGRLLAVPLRGELPPLPRGLGTLVLAGAASALGLAVLGLTATVALLVLDGMPHTVESIAYRFQAEIMAAGGMWAPAPPLPEFFQQAYVAATADGRWFAVLPPGQALILAAGLWAGLPWLVSPLATALAVVLTILLGRLCFGPGVGVLAGLLLVVSPFVLLVSGDMLAHPAGLLLSVVMTIAVVVSARGQPAIGWLLGGAAMGGLVLTRPLAAAGIGVPLTLLLVLGGRGTPPRLLALRAALFVAAALPGVLYAGAFNAALTGSASLPPLSLWSDVDRIGFGPDVGTRGGHDLTTALGNSWANLTVLLRHLYGWPSYLTLALAFVPFVLGRDGHWDRVLAVTVVGLLAAHWLYWSDGIVYGPRFTFEAVAALALLTARGVALLARVDASPAADPAEATVSAPARMSAAELLAATGAKGVPATLPDGSAPAVNETQPAAPAPATEPNACVRSRPVLSGMPFAATLLAALIAVNLVGYLPDVVLAYRDYNGISRAGLQVVEEAGLEDAVVFVTSDWPGWQSYGQVFLANGPFLDRSVIFARDLGESENWRLMTRYPERRGWLLRDVQLTEIRR